ncbi:hypothetical protein TSUD_154450 [Trifolium subterraneum]|uniref:Uncharacterized protein n=1 Tax=Trifolium subterraneum TaxID=3900 RepID=A0A2Z6N638_TRISU|nr:hypothetical protein TSUD_154450 [Trifolium subterraneum]
MDVNLLVQDEIHSSARLIEIPDDEEDLELQQDLDSSSVVAKHDDNKLQVSELITEGRIFSVIVDTVPTVVAEKKEPVTVVVVPLSTKATMNTISTTTPQLLIPSFDSGGNSSKQESSFTNPFPSQPSKTPDRYFSTRLSPSNLVPVSPPQLAPPWVYYLVYTISLDSPPLTITRNIGNSFHFDLELVIGYTRHGISYAKL